MPPDSIFWYELALKMAMTATIVVVASVAVERSGPFVGALIASLPTAAGAAYIILAIEHPPDFIAASAIGSLSANVAVAVFALTYAVLAQRHGLVASLGIATLAWFAAVAALRLVEWTPLSAAALNAAVFAVTISASWRYRTAGPAPKVDRRPFDIPMRAATAALVVAIVTTASHQIGSVASGMFAVFPIVMGSFVVILHPRVGGKAAASVLAHSQLALVGLGLGFLALHFLTAPIGVWWALLAGLAVCVGWNLMLWFTRRASARAA
jgi:uncharacterized membrane protein (GlpM family)